MSQTFETGANTAAANNLVLSVMNDGKAYPHRMHAGFAMLQGANHVYSFRELVQVETIKQRAGGSKFKAADISEAARIVQAQTVAHCLESLHSAWDGATIHCEGRKWWDKANGNTYFSARVSIPTAAGVRWVSIPFSYGYGSHWEFECMALLRKMGFVFPENVARSTLPVSFNSPVYMAKKHMFTGLYI